ncbi:LytTR family two component transcriptional regulator [Mucilaginibacter gracilis]|uniref:LytTR family two component transcriptional regulator n=1 Tax=Mucilaginibacter gracilis TaxID=423350 RepID=A0A495J9S9_9SPHI|nr:response regulator transcription factor [Mucilaginibacter gracilis]RKR85780.1 LytTR family two component transcriptional regulator [Mucilaginibacter gracilis]
MDKLKIIIVEDELIIAESLKSILIGMGYDVPAMFRSGNETLEKFRSGLADIIIMDIQLNGKLNGIETSMELRKISTAPIIYVTDNQDEYLRKKAIYETNTVQYVTKPFSRMDISIAIDLAIKALKKHDLKLKKDHETSYLVNDSIFVKESHGYKKIQIKDILYLQADRSYCSLSYQEKASTEAKEILFSENLSFLEDRLAFAESLVRVHRSFLININQVYKIQENRLWIGKTEIPIGKTYKDNVDRIFRFL